MRWDNIFRDIMSKNKLWSKNYVSLQSAFIDLSGDFKEISNT